MNTFQWERVAQEKLNVQKRVFFCFDSRHNMKYWSYLVEKLLQNIRIKCNHLQQFYPGWKDKAFPQPQRKIYLTWWWWLNKSLQISTMWLLFIMFHQKYKWNNQKRSTCFKRKKNTSDYTGTPSTSIIPVNGNRKGRPTEVVYCCLCTFCH